MSQAASNRTIPKSIFDRLGNLRRKLTGWMLVQGLSRWFLILLAILAVDMVLDRFFKMDFSQRLIMLLVMAVAAALFFFWRVFKPLQNRPTDDALLYQIEQKNKSLDEGLISSVQLAREKDFESVGVSEQLAEATIKEGVRRAESVDFTEVLNQDQYKSNLVLMIASLVAFGLLGIGVAKTDFLRTWFNRNVMLLDDQWPQGTYLVIDGVKDGTLTIPRGADHRQFVIASDESTNANVAVSLEIDNTGGRTFQTMKQTGKEDGRQHSFVFHNVSSTFRFRASGGDDVTEWVDVELVEPPAITNLELNANLPAYAQTDPLPLVGGGPHPVLQGSQLTINADANKKLSAAILRSGETEFPLTVAADGESFSGSVGDSNQPLMGGQYEFVLTDAGGLNNSRRTKFTITIRDDGPPKVRANLMGSSGLIAPRAMLPVDFEAVDQYGLIQLQFNANWKDAEAEQATARNFEIANLADRKDPSPWKQAAQVSVLDVMPLDLKPGTSFRLAVAATDNHPEPPGVGYSQEFLLRVVTEDELRADLLRREEEQRKAFEQAYERQLELTGELEMVAVAGVADGQTEDQYHAMRDQELISLVRDQKGIGTSIDRVASRFEEFLVEIKNNRLEEAENAIAPGRPSIEERYIGKIIDPIRKLDQELISIATRYLDKCRRNERDQGALQTAVDETLLVQREILTEMKKILVAMNDSKSFQDFLNALLEIKSMEGAIKTEVEKKMQPKNIFDDEPKGIFDDEK